MQHIAREISFEEKKFVKLFRAIKHSVDPSVFLCHIAANFLVHREYLIRRIEVLLPITEDVAHFSRVIMGFLRTLFTEIQFVKKYGAMEHNV